MTTRISEIRPEDMATWCAILRDDNAIHLSRAAAEAAGFGPRRVNPGPANLAWLLSLAGDDIASVDARFAGNVFEGNALEAEIGAPDPEGRRSARLSRGEKVLVSAVIRGRG